MLCFLPSSLVPTPFASLAFHPLDGYAQSVPYHVIPFVLPLNKWVYLGLFVIVNLWTIIVSSALMFTGEMCNADRANGNGRSMMGT